MKTRKNSRGTVAARRNLLSVTTAAAGAAALAGALVSPTDVLASTWTGTLSADWGTGSNWNPAAPPGASDAVVFTTSPTPARLGSMLDQDRSIASLTYSDPSGTNAVFTTELNSKSLSITSAGDGFNAGFDTGVNVVTANVQNGTLNVGTPTAAANVNIGVNTAAAATGSGANATVNLSNVNFAAYLSGMRVGDATNANNTSPAAAVGNLNLGSGVVTLHGNGTTTLASIIIGGTRSRGTLTFGSGDVAAPAGAITIGTAAGNDQLNLYVGRRTINSGASNSGVMDLSSAASFTANLNELAVGSMVAGTNTVGLSSGILRLAASNTITANWFAVGDSSSTPNPVQSQLLLGTINNFQIGNGSGTATTSSLVVGGRRSSGAASFRDTSNSANLLSVTGNTGTNRADVNVGYQSIDVTVPATGTLDLTGGTFSGLIDGLSIGRRNLAGTNSGGGVGVVTLGPTSTIDPLSVYVGAGAGSSGTLNTVAGAAVTIREGALGSGTARASFNIGVQTLAAPGVASGVVDFSNATLNATVSALTIGQRTNATNAAATGIGVGTLTTGPKTTLVASNVLLGDGDANPDGSASNGATTGTWNLNGGSVTVNNQFQVGPFRTGVVNQNGGDVSITQSLALAAPLSAPAGTNFASGTYNLNAGTVTARASVVLAANANSSAVLNIRGGTLTTPAITAGSGTATLNFTGGTLVTSAVPFTLTQAASSGPSIFSPGSPTTNTATANITGDYVANDAGDTLQIDLGGTTKGATYDTLAAAGSISLANKPTLNISLVNGFLASPGQTFDILDWSGSITDNGFNVVTPPTGGAYAWDLSRLYADGTISTTAVPEPSGVGVVALGGAWVLMRRRRRGGVA